MSKFINPLSLFTSRILIAISALVGLIAIGIAGYCYIEGYDTIDAFYMTIITMSTVGYGEVEPLTPNGKLFTSILIICSFTTFAYAISVITSFFVTGQFKSTFLEKKMKKNINELSGHIVVCGYGRVGRNVVKKLEGYQKEFVVIEKNVDKADRLSAKKKFFCIQGDATKDENLLEAGIDKASALILTMPKDTENLFAVLTAREINSKLTIITRASEHQSIKKLQIAGATNVIMPDSVGGSHMASLVVNPDIMEFIDHFSIQGKGDMNLEEIVIANLEKFPREMVLGNLSTLMDYHLNVIGCKRASGEIIINPNPKTSVNKEDKLFVLGLPQNITNFREHYN